MREIKFRGKRKDNGEWVYGYYFQSHGLKPHCIHLLDDSKGEIVVEILPETVGQYTGLKDKNSKEIYEGDRVSQAGHIQNSETKEEGNVERAENGRWFVRIFWMPDMQCHADIASDAEIIPKDA